MTAVLPFVLLVLMLLPLVVAYYAGRHKRKQAVLEEQSTILWYAELSVRPYVLAAWELWQPLNTIARESHRNGPAHLVFREGDCGTDMARYLAPTPGRPATVLVGRHWLHVRTPARYPLLWPRVLSRAMAPAFGVGYQGRTVVAIARGSDGVSPLEVAQAVDNVRSGRAPVQH